MTKSMISTLVNTSFTLLNRQSLTSSPAYGDTVGKAAFPEGKRALYITNDGVAMLLLPPGSDAKISEEATLDLMDLVTTTRHIVDEGLLLKSSKPIVSTLYYEGKTDFQQVNGMDYNIGGGIKLEIDGKRIELRKGGEVLLQSTEELDSVLSAIVADTMGATYYPTERFRSYVRRGCLSETEQALKKAEKSNILAICALLVTIIVMIATVLLEQYWVKTRIDETQFNTLIQAIKP